MGTQIDQEIPELPIPPYKNVDSGATFVTKAEAFRQALKDTFQPTMNYVIGKINIISDEVSTNTANAETAANIATAAANYKGNWIAGYNTTGYSVGMSVTFTDGFNYISKINNNLISPTSKTNTTEWGWVEKYENLNGYDEKTIPVNEDLLPLSDSTVSFSLKKITWANIKNTIATSFGGMINNLASKTAPVDADMFAIADSEATNETKKLTLSNLKANIVSLQFDKPHNQIPLFVKVSPSSIKIPAGLKLTVGNESFKTITDYTLTLDSNLVGSIKTAGTDYFVYAKSDSTFYISASDAITADRLIGGFHYGLTNESEAISGNKTEADMIKIRGINAYSFWDLKYFAKCGKNQGLFCNGAAWYDIYLTDTEYGINGYSRAFSQIAGGGTEFGRGYPKIPLQFGGNGTINYGKLTPFQAYNLAISAKKDLISYKEFTDIAYGVQEGLSQSEPVLGKNGHIPSLTSKYGMELATGNQYIWSSEIGSSTASGWSSITDSRGQVYTDAYVALLGGNLGSSAGVSGSRCSSWSGTLSYSDWSSGCRSRSDLMILD